MKDLSFPAAVKWMFALLISFWGGLPAMIQTLAICMAFDYATGLVRAWGEKSLSSDIGRKGLAKKVLTLVMLIFLRYAERRGGLSIHVSDGAALAYVVNEAISIIENVAHAGVPIPAPVVNALLSIQKLKAAAPASAEQLRALEDSAGSADTAKA